MLQNLLSSPVAMEEQGAEIAATLSIQCVVGRSLMSSGQKNSQTKDKGVRIKPAQRLV